MSDGTFDLVVVGAGIAGLSCARAAASAGLRTVVLERSAGVGGRCATRRVEGQPVDHGLSFLHGSVAEFLEALDTVDATPVTGWPSRVRGTGAPCQPAAFAAGERRMAFAEGLSVFPKFLAAGIDVRKNQTVLDVAERGAAAVVRLEGGRELIAERVVLALPCEQTNLFLVSLGGDDREVGAARRLLEMLGTRPCLTLLAGYPAARPAPDWDVWYPEDSKVLQMLANDSSKRRDPNYRVLVLQAHARWSDEHFDSEPAEWSGLLLAEAARLAGGFVSQPLWQQTHRWRYARSAGNGELSSPLLLRLPGGASIGLAGEFFEPGGGAQAAFLSGRALASRLAGNGASR